MIYILSKDDLRIKDMIQEVNYDLNMNINLNGKSIFTVPTNPQVQEGDFIICDNNIGYILNAEASKDTESYIIMTDELEALFNRKIILSNEEMLKNSCERFISNQILENFIWSDDPFVNIKYLVDVVKSDTPEYARINTEDGIYNLRTFLGNMLEKHEIMINPQFDKSSTTGKNKLLLYIEKRNLPTLEIDATIEDVVTYEEVYSVDAIAKVTVLSKESGNKYDYFLLADRTTTTDVNNPNRVSGKIECITSETDAEVQENALNEFRRNRYNHNIELQITNESKVVNYKDLIVGRKLRIKTKDNNIYETFISKINKKSDSNITTVTCGNMNVTFTDKLKGVV